MPTLPQSAVYFDVMAKAVSLLGLLVACAAAVGFFFLPVDERFEWALGGLVAGVALFTLGVMLGVYFHEHALALSFQRYAATRGFEMVGKLPSEDVPAVGVLKRGTTKRGKNVIALSVDGHCAQLLRWKYYVPTSGTAKHSGSWRERLVLIVRGWESEVTFALTPESIPEKFAILIGGQDIDFEVDGEEDTFSQTFRLRGSDEAAVRAFFAADLRAALVPHHTVAVETDGHALVVWHDVTLIHPWQFTWRHSFESLDARLAPALDELVEVARKFVSRDA